MTGSKAWRGATGRDRLNFPRPFIADLDDLPIPMHELLPLQKYRMPLIKGPFTFIVTSRAVRRAARTASSTSATSTGPAAVAQADDGRAVELKKLGIHNIHMYADLFTVNREQVMELCQRMIDEKINIKWTCNSRVDYVDEEMLALMGKAGNWLISWGIESGSEQILKHARKGAYPEKAERALKWAKKAGIKNWGYFIIGLPGETEATSARRLIFQEAAAGYRPVPCGCAVPGHPVLL
jgi:anaerobic magnesium-protoporphyrin IX monomethyl ester cyclase